MGQRSAKILQAFFVVMLAWYVYSVLADWHWVLALALLLLSLVNVVAIWMLQETRSVLAKHSHKPLVGSYLRAICFMTGQQMPADERPGAVADKLLLQTQREFDIAAGRAKQIVRGHDEVIDKVLRRVFENVTLRKSRRSNRSLGPIASLLLIGKDGIGKRYLSRVLAKLLYQSNRVEVFSCDRITPQWLIGGSGHSGNLLELVRREPFQVLIFERIDLASPDVCKMLSLLLTSGELGQPGSNSVVSFRNTIVVLTTKHSDAIVDLDVEALGPAAWEQKGIEYLRDEQQIDGGLLNAINEILLCKPPTDEVKAEVISLLLQKECRAHGIELSHVDPMIIGTQVVQVESEMGFAHSPNRIKKLLSRPLVAAAADEHDSLSLRVASVSPNIQLPATNR